MLAAVQPAEIAVLEGEMARRRPGVQAVQADSVPTRGPWTPAADCVVLVSVNGRGPGAVPGAAPPADSAVPPRRIVRVTLGGAAPPEGVWAFAPESDAIAQRLMAGVLLGDGAPPAGPTPSPTLLPAAPESAGMRVDSLRAIDAAMRSALEAGVFTGGVVVVARRGLVVKATGYGRTAGQPVDPASTLFDLASLTKIVGTTAATMALVDDSVLSVSDPLRRHLSGYRGGGRGDITLRHLLTHTSGLPAGADLFGAHSAQAAFGRVRRAELVTEPGEAYRYSDFGMILLAQAIESAAEEPIEQLLARRVYGRLGMRQTRYRPSLLLQERVVPTALRSERPYVLDAVVHDGNAFRLGGIAGHAGLFSTGMDVAVFAQTILNGGGYGNARVWSQATVQAFTTPQRLPGGRGLGWDVVADRSSAGDYFTARTVGHTGYTGTSLWIDLGREMFVVMLTNRTYDRGTAAQIFALRKRVHELAARSISDQRVLPRPGTAAARAAERSRRPAPRRTPRRPRRG